MKAKLIYSLIILGTIASCKKENDLKPNTAVNGNGLAVTVLTSLGVPQNSVITVAGGPYTSGPTLINDTGKKARFNGPQGIQLMNDNTIYVADTYNNVIRSISPLGVVSTFQLPVVKGYISGPIYHPRFVGITATGIVNIIKESPNGSYTQGRIYNLDSTFTQDGSSDFTWGPLAKDPYDDVFWFNKETVISKFTGKYEIGEDHLQFNNNFLPDYRGYYTFPALFMGYNKVAYFAFEDHLYKHTQDNTGSIIFQDLTFPDITCIVVNRDSRTIYVADHGYIKRIDSGKLTTIAGPNSTYHDSRDGVGVKADVYAWYLALSKDESTLYFSDTKANAVRKIVLR
jgi:hypothetical protein